MFWNVTLIDGAAKATSPPPLTTVCACATLLVNRARRANDVNQAMLMAAEVRLSIHVLTPNMVIV